MLPVAIEGTVLLLGNLLYFDSMDVLSIELVSEELSGGRLPGVSPFILLIMWPAVGSVRLQLTSNKAATAFQLPSSLEKFMMLVPFFTFLFRIFWLSSFDSFQQVFIFFLNF